MVATEKREGGLRLTNSHFQSPICVLIWPVPLSGEDSSDLGRNGLIAERK